jgi:alpha-glucosidase
MSRTGLPIERPLFLEFPDAAQDRHPIDLDAQSEFLFGPDILVAPAPYPDELDKYEVQLPPGIWYDYWTGERIDRSIAVESRDEEQKKGAQPQAGNTAFKPLFVRPSTAILPVYVRGGSIVPIAPLTQSTMEKPAGPLTLRVYVGEDCKGTLYQDDGQSYDFERGKYLRMASTCFLEGSTLHVRVGPHAGSYAAWWSEIAIEVYGLDASRGHAKLAGKAVNAIWNEATHCWQVTVPDNGNGLELEFEQ